MTKRLTKAMNFAFNAEMGGLSTVGQNPYVGSGSVNIPFQVKEILVKEMFMTTVPSVNQVVPGLIGGFILTLDTTYPAITVGMYVTGVGLLPNSQVSYSQGNGINFRINRAAAVPTTDMVFTTQVGLCNVYPTQLILANPNNTLATGQTVTGTGFTSCTITATANPLVWTLSVSQTSGSRTDLISTVIVFAGTVSGNILAVNGPVEVSGGATVTGTGVTAGTVITGMNADGEFIVNNIQTVAYTNLTITDANVNTGWNEMVQVQSVDGLFPPQTTIGITMMGLDSTALGIPPILHSTHHVFDTPQWLRGLYSVRLVRADGISNPLNAFSGFLCVVCEFVG